MPFVMALRERPHARLTSVTPPWPSPFASLAAISRRVRSFKSGQTDRNFVVSSRSPTTHQQHSTNQKSMVPLIFNGTLAFRFTPMLREVLLESIRAFGG